MSDSESSLDAQSTVSNVKSNASTLIAADSLADTSVETLEIQKPRKMSLFIILSIIFSIIVVIVLMLILKK